MRARRGCTGLGAFANWRFEPLRPPQLPVVEASPAVSRNAGLPYYLTMNRVGSIQPSLRSALVMPFDFDEIAASREASAWWIIVEHASHGYAQTRFKLLAEAINAFGPGRFASSRRRTR